VFTLYTRRLNTPGLFLGWLVGIVIGTGLAMSQGLKPVYALHFGDTAYPLYIGLIALVANIVVSFGVSVVSPRRAAVTA
jgi:SSS family solute:Na+ symporter